MPVHTDRLIGFITQAGHMRNHTRLRTLLSLADNVMYGSDYPYNFGNMAGILARVNKLKDDTRERVAAKTPFVSSVFDRATSRHNQDVSERLES